MGRLIITLLLWGFFMWVGIAVYSTAMKAMDRFCTVETAQN